MGYLYNLGRVQDIFLYMEIVGYVFLIQLLLTELSVYVGRSSCEES